ncbi:LysR family transcriptional regulator [Pseudomonas sp. DTU_2021_1001937_2_SI_NGA_ILE_001]|uniref:LysR family transcriptional regulator n=1 Tax=Pseudomonas sp. DTU_2021_1001937_2_SI_NGA_ILE_001 TaxID=3077589 RepID=UPI0028FC26EA|nr:LysR family transcriptional regulator [Pseudomonas sp. DTU_2021_1001937_2_SI_NGA_ILE_001]WNW11042.1 LysR family transcriptional regulator [Pseudomonas sp. DTU_2021_1001937_2_SI_NGA_ILE_001]
MDKLLAIRMFIETVDAQGFSAAARKLGLATSSVSRAVDALEHDLGATLLNRSTRQISVTEAGARYYQKARRVLDDLADADAQVSDRGSEPVGRLRVCVPVEFGRQRIAPHLGRWLARYPALELDLSLSDRLDDLLDGRFDVAIRLGAAASDADMVCRPLGEFRRWVVASPAYLASRGIPQAPQELAGHECLRFNYASTRPLWRFNQPGGQVEVAVQGRLCSDNADVLRQAVLDGLGLALLADWLVAADVAAGRLVRVLDDWECGPEHARSQINALYLPNHRGSRRVGAFMEFLEGLLNEAPR